MPATDPLSKALAEGPGEPLKRQLPLPLRAPPQRPGDRSPLSPLLLSVVGAALLVGCAQEAPFKRPQAPVPASWADLPGGAATGAAGVDAAQVHWRQYFNDRRLHALIEAALQNNRELRVAVARVAEARAQYGLTRADQTPNVNLLGQASVNGLTSTELSQNNTSRRFDLGLSSVSYEVDFWGRLANLSESARTSYLATDEARRSAELSLIAQVAQVYFAQRHFESLLSSARDTVHLRAQSLEIITRGRDIGAAFDLEVQQAEVLLENARSGLAQLNHQLNLTANLLSFLVGQMPEGLPPAPPFDSATLESELGTAVSSEVLLLRPDVMSAELRLAASHANISAARAAFLPRITLTASLGLASAGLLSLFQGGAWAFQPVLSLPIFDGGRLQSSLELAQARQVVAVAQYERTIQQAFREVADQLSARAALTAQLRSATVALRADQRRLQINQARFDAGLTGYLEVLEGQRALIASQETLVRLRRAQLEAAIELYKALGGGSQVRIEPVAQTSRTGP